VGGPGSKILDRAISVTHGRRKGEPCPSWILKLLAKRLFFQFRGVKTTFPPPGKNIGKIPQWPHLEEILPTPVLSWAAGPCNWVFEIVHFVACFVSVRSSTWLNCQIAECVVLTTALQQIQSNLHGVSTFIYQYSEVFELGFSTKESLHNSSFRTNSVSRYMKCQTRKPSAPWGNVAASPWATWTESRAGSHPRNGNGVGQIFLEANMLITSPVGHVVQCILWRPNILPLF